MSYTEKVTSLSLCIMTMSVSIFHFTVTVSVAESQSADLYKNVTNVGIYAKYIKLSEKINEHLLSLNLNVGALTCADCVGQLLLLRVLQCVDCCPLRIFPQLSNQLPVWFSAARYR